MASKLSPQELAKLPFVLETKDSKIMRVIHPHPTQFGSAGSALTAQTVFRHGIALNARSVSSSPTSITPSDMMIAVNADASIYDFAGTRFDVHLPENYVIGQVHIVKDVAGTANTVVPRVLTSDSTTIDGASFYEMSDINGSVGFMWTGTEWSKVFLTTSGSSGGGGAPVDATYLTLSANATLTKERIFSVSGTTGLRLIDAPPSVGLSIDNNVVATVTGTTFTGRTVHNAGLSGSLTRLTDGRSYLAAGSNITIVSSSGDQITISATSSGGGGGSGDPGATYIVLSTTASLSNERVLNVSGTTGLLLSDTGANGNANLSINNNIVATVSGTTFSGVTSHTSGLSGSLTRLTDGTSYIVAGTNITVASQSNGQVTITSTASSTTPTRYTIDSNTKHAYLCSDASGSTSLADTGTATAAPLTFVGFEGAAYVLASGRPFTQGTLGIRFLDDTVTHGAQVSASLGLPSGPFTIEGLFFLEEFVPTAATVDIVMGLDDGTVTNTFHIGIINTGNIFAGTIIGGVDKNTITAGGSTVAFPINIAVHILATYDSTNGILLYRNGRLVGGAGANGTLPAMTRITLGNLGNLLDGMRGWVGEARVSTVARTAAEALASAEAALKL